MKKPIIFSVDDDPQVLKALRRDLRANYKNNYRILNADNPQEALELLPDLKKDGEEIALFVSDQRMPTVNGVEFLEKSLELYPKAKRVLLTAYSEIDAAIKAINDVQLDYYLLKPWNPPEEKLYPVLDELLDDWQADFIPPFEGLKILGYQYSPKAHQIKDFLSGNLLPYQWLNVESSPIAKELVQLHRLENTDLPAVVLEDGELMKNPSPSDLGGKIGLSNKAKETLYDVAIIGAGPAGLAAGVYGGSEGLKTLLIEKRAPGGQAGTSSRIENYLGFPKGLSGSELSRRAITQATRFGVEFLSPQEVENISLRDQYKILTLKDGTTVLAKSIVITTGVDYRKLEAKGLDKFTGAGVYYGAATTEATTCENQDVYIVGGGNSAGQAAMYLSRFARNVYIVIRKPNLTSSMSSYLIDQIDGTDNISVLGETEIVEGKGEDRLTHVVLKSRKNGDDQVAEAAAIFIFIGAKPYTEWLGDLVLKNQRGFIITGYDLSIDTEFQKKWKTSREPFSLETSQPGIFAAGDVRANAMNRVASAVGEGAMSISYVHKYLSEM